VLAAAAEQGVAGCRWATAHCRMAMQSGSSRKGQFSMGSYFSFQGRITRSVYWLQYVLPLTLVNLVAAGIDAAAQTVGVFGLIAALATLVPNIAAGVKRCHDRDRSGWFVFIVLIPLVGVLWYFVEIGFLRGTLGSNKYGTDPLRGIDVEAFR